MKEEFQIGSNKTAPCRRNRELPGKLTEHVHEQASCGQLQNF